MCKKVACHHKTWWSHPKDLTCLPRGMIWRDKNVNSRHSISPKCPYTIYLSHILPLNWVFFNLEVKLHIKKCLSKIFHVAGMWDRWGTKEYREAAEGKNKAKERIFIPLLRALNVYCSGNRLHGLCVLVVRFCFSSEWLSGWWLLSNKFFTLSQKDHRLLRLSGVFSQAYENLRWKKRKGEKKEESSLRNFFAQKGEE